MKTKHTYLNGRRKSSLWGIGRLLSCLFAFALSACADETIPDIPKNPPAAQKATLSVRVATGSNTGTRIATGNLVDTGAGSIDEAERAINHIEVWVFNGNTLDAYANSKDAANPRIIQDIIVTQGIRTIYVAANTDIGEEGVGIGEKRTGDQDLPITQVELLNQTAVLSQDITNGMIMTAAPFTATLIQGHNMLGNPAGMPEHPVDNPLTGNNSFNLTRINTRIALTSLQFDFSEAHDAASKSDPEYVAYDRFVLEEIIFLNMRQETAIFPNLRIIDDVYRDRLTWMDLNEDYKPTFLFGSHVPDSPTKPIYIGSPGIVPGVLNAGVITEEDVVKANDEGLIGNSGGSNPYGFIGLRNASLHRKPRLVGSAPLVGMPTPMIGYDTGYHLPFYVYALENTNGDRGGGTFLVLKGKLWQGDPNSGGRLFTSAGLQTSESTDNEGNTYYVIWINRGDMGYGFPDDYVAAGKNDGVIRRNTQYNIEVLLTRAGSAGASPTASGSAVEVHMHIQNWRSVGQDVEWRP